MDVHQSMTVLAVMNAEGKIVLETVRNKRSLWPNSLVAWNVTHSMFRICQIKYQKPYSMDRS